jgi:hypothetical protein
MLQTFFLYDTRNGTWLRQKKVSYRIQLDCHELTNVSLLMGWKSWGWGGEGGLEIEQIPF